MAKNFDYHGDWIKRGKPNPNRLSRFSVDVDRYDKEDFSALLKEMEDFPVYREKLVQSAAGDLGYDVWQDIFSSFWKVDPKLLPDGLIRPSHIINKVVMSEAYGLGDFKELRSWTQGDDIGAAMACISIEPDMETLYDRLKEEIKKAKELSQSMAKYGEIDDELKDLEKMFEEWTQENPNPDEQEATDWNEKFKQMQERMDAAEELIKQQSDELGEGIESAKPEIKQGMKEAMSKAAGEVDNMNNMADSWGLEPGQLRRLPPDQRLELAKKMNNPKFKRIAQLFGPMKRLAFTEQKRKVNYAPEEIYDIEQGSDLEKVLVSEKMKLRHKFLKYLFFKDFLESRLPQYKMRGYEKVGRGGIIFCEDGSGSMSGDREIWAKAVGLCLLHIAKKQKRPFYAIHFGSPGQIHCMDFRDVNDITPDRVIEFAELFFGGGTDFRTPLQKSLDILNEEFAATGAVKADIVFATDGMCGLPDDFLQHFKEEQKKMSFKLWGVNIGGNQKDQPLYDMAEGRVATIRSLTNGDNVREVFGGL